MNRVLILILTIATLMFSACTNEQSTKVVQPEQKPNIILMIGDGMGMAQLSSAFYYKSSGEVAFEKFPYAAFMNTSSMTHKITDSGAAASAFATGQRTKNKRISTDTSGVPLTIITELLAANGYVNGIVATSQVTHATPAAFYAKQSSRKAEEEIAAQLPNSFISYAAAGGYGFFNQRQDKLNYFDSLRAYNYLVDTNIASLDGVPKDAEKVAFLLNKLAMPTMLQGRGDFLPKATRQAASFLGAKENPFFLMVEGSQIDWACHDNDTEYLIQEVLDFEKAVEEAYNFAVEDGNTIVIVTADHETGGFALSADDSLGYNVINPAFATDGHSASLVPVLMYVPEGVKPLNGIIKNTDVFEYIRTIAQ